MGLLSGIGKIFGGIGKALGGISKLIGGILNSPLGKLLQMAFPPLGLASGAMSFVGMMGDLSSMIGGGQRY